MTEARTITTQQGDTIDVICYRYFGESRNVTEQVLALNPEVSATVVFLAGVSLLLPIHDKKATPTIVSLWD